MYGFLYVISRNIKINILQDAEILKLFFPVSSTPLLVLDAEMDMGAAPIKALSDLHLEPIADL